MFVYTRQWISCTNLCKRKTRLCECFFSKNQFADNNRTIKQIFLKLHGNFENEGNDIDRIEDSVWRPSTLSAFKWRSIKHVCKLVKEKRINNFLAFIKQPNLEMHSDLHVNANPCTLVIIYRHSWGSFSFSALFLHLPHFLFRQ